MVVVMSIVSCSTNGEIDSITIVSVSPNSGLANGANYDFTVVVDYELMTKDQGELDIGFNNGSDINSYIMLGVDQIVNQGSGQYMFNVFATAKDWGLAGDFGVFVYISEYPHGVQWTPLDSDIMILTF
jgi:hypothetical protein